MPLQNPLAKENIYRQVCFFFLAVALLSLAFDVRIVNSISLISLVVLTLLKPDRLVALRTAFRNPFFIACFLSVLLTASGLLFTNDTGRNMQIVSTKASLVAIPFFFCAGNIVLARDRKKLFAIFNTALLLVMIICLVLAAKRFTELRNPSVFFYHQLLSPFRHHAIYFSFFLFFCSVFWIEQGTRTFKVQWKFLVVAAVILFNLLSILLLSSKLVITISFAYLLYLLIRIFLRKKQYLLLVACLLMLLASVAVVLFSPNPVSKRFKDLKGNLSVLKQEKFATDMYFNGFQFRLLNWRFTYEVLNEQNAWLTGTSAGDAQTKLNEKYVSVNLYHGESDGSEGYLVYNSHNQFLESTVQSGIPGLVLAVGIVVSLFIIAYRSGKREPKIIAWSILPFCFTESMLETQYGIFLFSFFALIAIYSTEDQPTQKLFSTGEKRDR